MQDRYERNRRTFASMRRLVEALETARTDAGMSKADLARAVGATPSVVRRLLTDEESNPTLKTLVELSDAVGLRIRLERVSDGQPVAVVPEAEQASAHAAG